MSPLIETNHYLRDPQTRRRMIAENVYDSSVFEVLLELLWDEPYVGALLK